MPDGAMARWSTFGPGVGNAAIVEPANGIQGKLVRASAEALVAEGAGVPRFRRLWVVAHRETEPSRAWVLLVELLDSLVLAALVLAAGGGSWGSGVKNGWVSRRTRGALLNHRGVGGGGAGEAADGLRGRS